MEIKPIWINYFNFSILKLFGLQRRQLLTVVLDIYKLTENTKLSNSLELCKKIKLDQTTRLELL